MELTIISSFWPVMVTTVTCRLLVSSLSSEMGTANVSLKTGFWKSPSALVRMDVSELGSKAARKYLQKMAMVK